MEINAYSIPMRIDNKKYLKEWRENRIKNDPNYHKHTRQRNKKWRLEYPNYMKKQYRKQIENNPIAYRIRRLLHTSKKSAKAKNFEHSLDKQWCLSKFNGVCEATGLPFDLSVEGVYRKMNPFAPSIDRFDNNIGYTKDNCQMVVWIYNNSKNAFTDKNLYIMCKAFIKKYEYNN